VACTRTYSKEFTRKKRAEGKAFIDSVKESNPCKDCNKFFSASCVDFDHVKGEKRFNLSLMRNYSIEAIKTEISKCDLVCANCHRIRTASRLEVTKNLKRKEFLTKLNNFKSKPCFDCGEYFPAVVMDFDHVQGTKTITVSGMRGYPWASVLEEIAKCDLVCANCHRLRTKIRRKPGALPISALTLEKRRKKQIREANRLALKEHGIELLGIVSDIKLASKFGVASATVRKLRTSLGIPPSIPHVASTEWLDYLGTMSDRTLADRFKKNLEVVRRKRVQLGIPVYTERPWHKLAGTMPDKAVAKIGLVSNITVFSYRKRKGIPAFQHQKRKAEFLRRPFLSQGMSRS
jgi:hypothetical protein